MGLNRQSLRRLRTDEHRRGAGQAGVVGDVVGQLVACQLQCPGQRGRGLTDEGNVILDCHCGVIEVPEETAAKIRNIVGVVEHGLFLDMATLALVASENGVRELRL